MKQKFILFTILFISIIFLASCKKDNSTPKNCKIISAIYQSGATTVYYSISYGNNGRPAVMTSKNGAASYTRTFTYDANTITAISVNNSGAFNNKTVVTLNGNNKIANVREFQNSSGTMWDNTQILYDNNGNVFKEMATTSTNSSPTTLNYTVTDGDIVTTTQPGSTDYYNYYLDKPFQPGDYFAFFSVVQYGVLDGGYRKNNHLIKSILNSGSTNPAQFTYQMDGNGLISILTISSPTNSTTISYQYECN